MFLGPLTESIVKRAEGKKQVSFTFINPRDFATDAHKSVDDHPYGGGQGMVLRVDVIDQAIEKAKQLFPKEKSRIILLTPQGSVFTQKKAVEIARTYTHLILVCGHYEGIDERIRSLVDEEISIGDYVLTGGEIPAMVLTDSIVRLLPNVLKKEHATTEESFSQNQILLEFPQYTKPQKYKSMEVPQILLSGNHANIEKWKKEESMKRTKIRRPDLLHETITG